MRKFPFLAALTLGLSLTLTACGSDTDGTSDTQTSVSTTEHNDADVAFATGMIQHHAQALDMVDMTEGRDLDPEVEALADDIRAAQAPEIETMTGWLNEWGEDVPDTASGDDMEGHDMGDMGDDSAMSGMMTEEDMAALEDASDAEFQDMWLEMMIEHHEGAVEMAATEEANGEYKPAVDLAKTIQESQTAEIDTMQQLLS